MRDRAPSSRRIASLPSSMALLALTLVLSACSHSEPRTYPPLRYDYLTPIRLNVQSVTVDPRFFPSRPNDVSSLDPAPPVQTLTAMAQDRLQAVGNTGRAVFVIKNASLVHVNSGIEGSMDVELDVYGGGGTRAGFAEARVSRSRTGDIDDIQGALYDMTKQMMDAMNIEFEYQVRHSLRDWLAPASAAPGPVQQQNLAPPSPTGSPLAAPSPAPSLGPPLAPVPDTVPGSSLGGPQPTQLLPPRQP